MSLKGRQSIGKLENNVDSLRENYLYATVTKSGSGKVALDTVQKKFAQVSLANVVESGSTNHILKKTAHGLKEGYMIRIATTANGILEEEVSVDEVIDANNVKLSAFLSADLAAGDTFDIYKPVSERVALDGSSLATVVSPPIQIIKNGAVMTVEDSTTPADVVAVPVVIKAVDGTNITINAGDISVQNSAEGVNFDSMRIGDGTAKYAGITADLELSTHDQGVVDAIADLLTGGLATEAKQDDIIGGLIDVETELQTLNAKDFATETTLAALAGQDFATEAKQDTQITAVGATNTKLDTIIAKDFATSAKQDASNTKLDTIIAKDFSTATKQDALAVLVGATNETPPAVDTGISGLSGRLQRIAQRLSTIIGSLPSTVGQKAMTDSLSVVIANNQSNIPVVAGALTPSYSQANNIGNSAVTITAPAGAKWCKMMAPEANAVYLRACMGSTATTTNGMQFQPGRSEDFQVAGDISVICETSGASQTLMVQWGY